MNNIQVNNGVNLKSSAHGIPQGKTVEIHDQSPEQLKQKVENGELNETDFPSKEDFEKFIAFLSKMLSQEIKTPAKNESVVKADLTDQKSEKVATNGVEAEKKNQLKFSEMEIVKEGINPSTLKQMKNEAAPLTTANQNAESKDVDLFKANSIEKSNIIKEQSIQINDKTVVLHTSGGNNLSITGTDVGAQGDATFLEESRNFANEEGYQERNGEQLPSQSDENELERIYFTKDS